MSQYIIVMESVTESVYNSDGVSESACSRDVVSE